jgi:hypothetical protein
MVLCKQRGGANPPNRTNINNMENTGTLILKYNGETYSNHEVKLPIVVTFFEDRNLEMTFSFEFTESPTKELVVFNQLGNINSKAVMQPYGIEIIIPNDNTFFVQFMMVEDLPGDDDTEMFTAVAKFDVPFTANKNQYSIYNF